MPEGDAGRRGKVTIRSVAEDAGVSTAAVSKVLRNAYGVSDALREKVEVSIAKLGYRPSTAARAMRGRTYSVGVLMVELSNPFLASLVEGISPELSAANYQYLIGVSASEVEIERGLVDRMIDNRMDGLILIAPRMHGALLADCARQIPTVVIGHHETSATSFDTVNSDDRAGGRMATEHLIACHGGDVAMISLVAKPGGFDVFHERERGYREAMAAAGHGDLARIIRLGQGAWGASAGEVAACLEGDLPRALFCWSDIHAVPVAARAAQLGIAVPGDLAVAGYDNSTLAALPQVGLTSVEQHGPEIGRLAARALLSRIEGRSVPEHLLVAPDLVVRRSSGAAT